ncbi:DUF6455 family protein [Cribrihabitans neustonicus]|uniref:DUF6455 family protein n=1 Tax=Cribrihabitans neustonicus TaxID=1429085 RepID=UPI003B594436
MKDLAQTGAAQTGAPLGSIFRHLWLLKAVADSAGVDLGAALKDGRLNGLDYARMVTSCRGAGCSNSCALWLSSGQGGNGAVPAFCPSAELLERLKP